MTMKIFSTFQDSRSLLAGDRKARSESKGRGISITRRPPHPPRLARTLRYAEEFLASLKNLCGCASVRMFQWAAISVAVSIPALSSVSLRAIIKAARAFTLTFNGP